MPINAPAPHTTAPYSTLISVSELQQLRANGTPHRVFDCSFNLMQPEAGRAQFAQEHIAGAVHADLDWHLSAAHDQTDPVCGGRHPLPQPAALARWLGSMGLTNGMQAVVYDRQGLNYCGRLWWLLQWLGHAQVAVLDGGWQAWVAAGGAVEHGDTPPATTPAVFTPAAPLVPLVLVAQVQENLGRAEQVIVDARATPRFKGEVEPIDPVAGHIPGALNRPFGSNLDANGYFKPAATLRAEFSELMGPCDPKHVVHHCGSGVSAVPNILAMEYAGLHGSALYAGSWSEWCNDTTRPVARG